MILVQFPCTTDGYNALTKFIASEFKKKIDGEKGFLYFPDEKLSFILNDYEIDKSENEIELEYVVGLTGSETINFHLEDCRETVFSMRIEKEGDQPIRHLDGVYRHHHILIESEKHSDIEILTEKAIKYNEDTRYGGSSPDKIKIYKADESWWSLHQRRNKRGLDTIYISEEKKKSIVEKIENFLKPKTQDLYEKYHKTKKLIFLLHGKPGTGKTSIVHALASHFNFDICTFVHSRKKSNDMDFSNLLANRRERSFVMIEEIDTFISKREDGDGPGLTLNGILQTLDGFLTPESRDGKSKKRRIDPLIIFATTNMDPTSSLDQALIRPGRLDMVLELEGMKKKELKKMFRNFMGDEVKEEQVSQFMENFSKLKVEVTPALMELFLFKYVEDPESCLKNMDEIKQLKKCTEETKKSGLYI